MKYRVSMELRESNPLRIDGGLTIAHVARVHALLAAAFAERDDVVCDLAAVDACDTAGAQLLCAAAATARAGARSFRLTQVPPVVIDAVARIGLDAQAIGLSVDEGQR
jgi:anti-anti-sigma regulatory factor